jgi:hypothetical protein
MLFLTNFFYILSVFFALLFGLFRFLDTYYQTSIDKVNTKNWYGEIWEKINKTETQNLPESLIKWLLNSPKRTINYLKKYKAKLIILFIGLFPIIAVLTFIELSPRLFLLQSYMIAVFSFIGIIIFQPDNYSKLLRHGIRYVFIWVSSMAITETAVLIGGDMTWNELETSTYREVLSYWYLSNILFDTLTVWFTFKLLSWVLKTHVKLYIFILIDIVIVGIFALLSLYIGVYFTSFRLSFIEALNVFIGFNPDGKSIHLGSFFWAMHTTYIPILIYLFVLGAILIGKAVILPLSKIIKKASVIEKPHYLTATFFAFIGGVFAALGIFTNWLSN